MINVGTCSTLNAGATTLLDTLTGNETVYRVASLGQKSVLSFDVFTRSSTGGSVTVPAHIYSINGSLPEATPLASTTITIGPNAGWYTATFAAPVTTNGSYFIGFDNTAQDVYLAEVLNGSFNLSYERATPASTWSFVVMRAAWQIRCTDQPLFPEPKLDTTALPLLGTSYDVTLTDGLSSSLAVLVSGTANTGPVGVPLPDAPGCDLYVVPQALDLTVISATGTAARAIVVPNSPTLTGAVVYHQWAVLDVAANTLGIVSSDAGTATVGS